MNISFAQITFLSLILILGGVSTAPAETEVDRLDAVYDFLKAHLIGNTLTHQHHTPMESESAETEVTHRQTYTNLTKQANALSFDVFSVVTHADYKLDADGKRLQETRSMLERNISLARYTAHRSANAQELTGTSRYLSHTATQLKGTIATFRVWFDGNTLKLIAQTLLPPESTGEGEPEFPIVHIRAQDFWVEDQRLLSRSRSMNYKVDADTLALTSSGSDENAFIWHEEGNRARTLQLPDPIHARETHLIAVIREDGDEATFLVIRDGYLYPCKIVDGLLESFPLQADVKTYHNDTDLRTVFYKLHLPEEMDATVYTMEIFSDTHWKPATSFQWDGNAFSGKLEEASKSKIYPLDQIRFKQ